MTQETLPTCVVLMPPVHEFNGNNKFRDLYERVIKPEVEKAGFQPWSPDDASPEFRLIDEVRLTIKESDLVIADLSDNNPNIMYEIGWAQASRKPVLLMSRDINLVPFNLLGSRVLLYDPDKAEDFRKKLERYLRIYTHEKV